jgi:intein/homing endonuclease
MWKFFKRFLRKEQFGYGWVGDEREQLDERNYHTEEIFKSYPSPNWIEKKPSEWRKFEPIRNQSTSGSCVAHSLALALGIENYLEEGKFEILSARFIYSRGYVEPDGGMYYLQALEIARKEGTCLEQQMPSIGLNENAMRRRDDETPNVRWVAQIYKANSYVFLPLDIDVIAGIIEQTKKGILLGVRFNQGGFSKPEVVLDKNGIFGHAICFHPDTLILTKNGYKKITEIKAGDYVLTHKGRWQRVSRVLERDYEGYLFKIYAKNQIRPILATPEHPFYVINGSQYVRKDYAISRGFMWKKAEDLKIKDFLLANFTSPITQLDRNYALFDEDIAYLVGLYLADGNLKRNFVNGKYYKGFAAVRFSLNREKDSKIIEKVVRIMKSKFNLEPKFYYSPRNKAVQVIFYSTKIANWFAKIAGRPNKKRLDYRIIFNSPKDVLRSLLEGWIDGDGSIQIGNKNQNIYWRLFTSDEKLALQIQLILQKLNMVYSVFHRKPAHNITRRIKSSGGFDFLISPYANKIKTRNFYHKIGELKRIKKIEKIKYVGKVFNLEVENDNSYMAENVAVHNCATDYTLYNGKKALIFQNSWGRDDWGINGLGIINEEQFKNGVVLGVYLVDFKYEPQKINKPKMFINANYLNVGDRGSEVVKLQIGLQWLGYFPANQECTGYYGGITRQAVRDFQKNYGLLVTGTADLNTIKKFNEIFGR